MAYNKKPKMILFDVGGTLFEDGPCRPVDGFGKLRLYATNPHITTDAFLAERWTEFLEDMHKIKSASGINLDVPLSAVIKYATMKAGLHFNISTYEQEEIFDRFNSTRAVIDGVPELLKAIKLCGIRTAVISNNMMSGESLSLAIKRWIPSAEFEFCLTSADLLYTKPCAHIFETAVGLAHLDPDDCWYCGDGHIPDVYGALNSNLHPVLLDKNSSAPFEIRTENDMGEYLAVNHWSVLKNHILSL